MTEELSLYVSLAEALIRHNPNLTGAEALLMAIEMECTLVELQAERQVAA